MQRTVLILFLFISFHCLAIKEKTQEAEGDSLSYRTFKFEKVTTLPGEPTEIYDAISGDISEWWDHSFSKDPYKLFIEAKPGGGFYEYFNEQGDGVLHATVIAAQRGKLLRFDGPLGLSGLAVQIVTTYYFAPAGNDSTELKVEVHGAGELTNKLPAIVEKVWEHFIFERFVPYVENRNKVRNE
ncbi:SRPBCC domain-containing protein [Puteibacter caeruleilacunae]|nr:SRPBCC domain-containing protein [Puteibacter caeruleilacunae]